MTPNPRADDDRTRIAGGPHTAAPAGGSVSLGHNALDTGTNIGEFEIVGLVGEGGFGIVYLAHDHSLDRKVALKEYMPSELAQRDQTGVTVVVRSQRHVDTFAAGLRSFINEARLLAQFDHPSLVKVYRFWEQNGTAYMVMPFYEGRTLKQTLKELDGAPHEDWLKALVSQLLDALEVIHSRQCYHRDIAPDNILILPDETPLLLDFGAARRVIGDMTQALTVILKPGYAPIEQYAEVPNLRQGPWTDIYALASVMYFALVGKPPVPAVARVMSDPLTPLAEAAAGRYSETFLRGADAALAVRPEDRPQDVAEFRRMLGLQEREPIRYSPMGGDAATRLLQNDSDATRQLTRALPPAEHAAITSAPPRAATAKAESRPPPTSGTNWYAIGGALLTVLLLAGYLLFIFLDDPLEQQAAAPPTHNPSAAETPTHTPSSSSETPTHPPPPLAQRPVDVGAMNSKLAGFDCALLSTTMRGDTALVQGHVASSADLKRIATELGAVSGVKNVDHSVVRIFPRPYCSVVSALAPYAAPDGSSLNIALKGGRSAVYEGDKLVTEIVGPEFDGFVYADLYDPEGNVVHLLPNPRENNNQVKARQRLMLGDDPVFGMQWDVVPPLGPHLLVVMASSSQLFERERPQVEEMFGYLRAIRESASTRSGAARLVAHHVLIEVAAKN